MQTAGARISRVPAVGDEYDNVRSLFRLPNSRKMADTLPRIEKLSRPWMPREPAVLEYVPLEY